MKEENNGTPKNKWSRIYRKKWFFPAVYLVVAALLVSVVVWYQNMDKSPQANKEPGDAITNLHNQDAKEVADQTENVKMPVADAADADIVTKFFDYNADEETRQAALVLYNSRYYQSKGLDITAKDEKKFDVIASLSGTVEEVKEDPLMGHVVVMEHGDDVKTYYASLEDVAVKTGDSVKQGDKLGIAGNNLFGKDNGKHVHFELSKSGEKLNPEQFFNQPVSKIDTVKTEDATDENNAKAEENEQQEPTDDQGKAEENDSGQSTDKSDGQKEDADKSDDQKDDSDKDASNEDDQDISKDQDSSNTDTNSDKEASEKTDSANA